MSRLETVSTASISPRRKIQFWNETISATVTKASAEPLDEPTFEGELRRLDVGKIRFAEIHGGASTVRRWPARIRSPIYVLQLILSGEILCYSGGARTRLAAGDFWLYSSSVGAELLLPQPVSLLAICVQRDQLVRYIGCPEAAASVAISSRSAAGALVAGYLRDFWNSAAGDLPEPLVSRFADIALQLTAGAYAGVPDAKPNGSSRLTSLRLKVRSHIEEHLGDPTLDPRSIAAALELTPSYLYRLFSDNTESIARYILRRRLEECHRILSDCMHINRSVTEIAFDHGFNNLAHFSRVFRNRYGTSPRELRNRAARHRDLGSVQ
jgi:AraC family transcriptional regulator, positive regulator of tynA and feaB